MTKTIRRPGDLRPSVMLLQLDPPQQYQLARLLEQAGEFQDEEWTQGAKARTGQGHAVPILPPGGAPAVRPVRYCAIGHIERVCRANELYGFQALLMNEAMHQELGRSVPIWNDQPDTTATQVRETFRQVSARLYRQAVAGAAAQDGIPAPAPAPAPAREPETRQPSAALPGHAPARLPAAP